MNTSNGAALAQSFPTTQNLVFNGVTFTIGELKLKHAKIPLSIFEAIQSKLPKSSVDMSPEGVVTHVPAAPVSRALVFELITDNFDAVVKGLAVIVGVKVEDLEELTLDELGQVCISLVEANKSFLTAKFPALMARIV